MNGLLKIPMQFLILLIGCLLFVFYQFQPAPLFYNDVAMQQLQEKLPHKVEELQVLQANLQSAKTLHSYNLLPAIENNDQQKIDQIRHQLQRDDSISKALHKEVQNLLKAEVPSTDNNDSNYVFLYFITHHVPVGIVGILMAIIFLAAMGSTASGMNSLASATYIDFVQNKNNSNLTDAKQLKTSRQLTLAWGLFCIVVAFFASRLGNLIEAVNILGSLFYGTILGIFMVAFFLKRVDGVSTFIAAIITETFIVVAWLYELTAFLWLNVIGCLLLMLLAYGIQLLRKPTNPPSVQELPS